MTAHADEAAEAGVAMAKQPLGIGEGSLHRLFASGMDQFAHIVRGLAVGTFAGVLRDVAGDRAWTLAFVVQ